MAEPFRLPEDMAVLAHKKLHETTACQACEAVVQRTRVIPSVGGSLMNLVRLARFIQCDLLTSRAAPDIDPTYLRSQRCTITRTNPPQRTAENSFTCSIVLLVWITTL